MSMDIFNLKGKTAIVTGASQGIGKAFAIGLAEAGANVVGVSRSSSAETGEAVKAAGAEYLELHADLVSTEPISGIVTAALEKFNHIDILVNNAGIIRREDSLNFTEKDWDDVMNVNLKSLFFLSQAVGKHMVEKGIKGKIINVASMLSFQGGIRVPSYTSSKSGVMGLTRLLACEWAKYGICINAIAPGYIDTDNTAPLIADPVRSKAILERIPAGRWGDPSDLKGAVVFLASSASDYVNGYTLAVDGGWLAR